MKIYWKKSFLEIYVDEQEGFVLMQWLKYARSEEFREGLTKGLEAVRTYKVNKWFANLTNMKVISSIDQEWVNKEWFPLLIQTNKVNKMGIVVSEDIFNKLAVENIMSRVTPNFEVCYFEDMKKAAQWLDVNSWEKIKTS